MGKMSLEIPHSLSKDDALARAHLLTEAWGSKYGVRSTWNGDGVDFHGKVMGIALEGTMRVLDGKISGEATDPGMLLRGQAKKYVERKFAEYLDPKKTLGDLKREV
jgi:hypothetical protein